MLVHWSLGSTVAPVLTDIFLGKDDMGLQARPAGKVKGIFRFVDDFLISHPKSAGAMCMIEVLSAFQQEGRGLRYQLPSKNEVEFLDSSSNSLTHAGATTQGHQNGF